MKGRPPVPREQKVRRGTLRKHRDPGPVAVPLPLELRPLGELPPHAQEAWDQVVPPLVEAGVVSFIDAPLLTELCSALGVARQARETVEAEGVFVTGAKGGLVTHPAWRVQRDATVLALRIAEQYGLSPSARARLGLSEMRRRSLYEELTGR